MPRLADGLLSQPFCRRRIRLVNNPDAPSELHSRITALERQLAAFEQQQSLLLYTLSHDLRTPIMTILGFADMLLADAQTAGRTTDKQYLERIRTAAQRQVTLIEGLLKVAGLQEHPPHTELCELGALAQSCWHDLLAHRPNQTAALQIDAVPAISCDPRLIGVVLRELLSNALKFTRDVAAPEVYFGAARDARGQYFFVRDNGIGFDAARAPRLFRISQRLHAQRGFEGSGLGLVTAAAAIKHLGGDIWAESQIDQGTTVYFRVAV